jgi:hypothetical protein
MRRLVLVVALMAGCGGEGEERPPAAEAQGRIQQLCPTAHAWRQESATAVTCVWFCYLDDNGQGPVRAEQAFTLTSTSEETAWLPGDVIETGLCP